jgi:hypothetical protein
LEENAVKANELLLWLSARSEGSWRVFRAAVEELHLAEDLEAAGEQESERGVFPLHQQLRLNMERLGHVEFFARDCEEGWRVVPPTLALTRGLNDWMGVLCGARSDRLLEHFVSVSRHLQVEVIPRGDAPDVYRVFASDKEDLSKVCEQCGLLFQSDAPLAILSYLLPTDPPLRNGPTVEFPQGTDWKTHKFLPETLSWREVNRADANSARTGFFRFRIYFQRERYFLRYRGRTFEVPRGAGIYALLRLRRHNVLRYNGDARSLTLPAVCRPPRLLERALVLCSGLPPTFDARDSQLVYADVQPEVVIFAAQLLRQSLL